MNPRDELIRRALMHIRNGYAVGGKPGESAMSRAEAERGVSSGNYGGQTARAEAGSGIGGGNAGADRLGAGSQISNTTSMAERAAAMTNPAAQNARLGPNAAQAMVGAGVSPDAALRSAMSINERGIPAMDRIATTAPTIDATRAVLDYSQKSNVPAQMSRFLDPKLGSMLASIKAGENIPSPISPAMTGEGWVDIEKGTNVNSPDVQNLINMAKAASAQTGQRLTITDAIAPRDTSLQHPAGLAIDLKAYSPVTGKALPNYQTPETFSAYEKIANAMRSAQQGSFPQYNDTFRWGGYFGD